MTEGPLSKSVVSFEDYLEAEREAEVKHEWLDGAVYVMPGGSVEHGRLAANVMAALRTRLAGRCTVLSSDVMVFVRETNLATYPDGSVVCGPLDIQRIERHGRVIGEAVLNPTFIVEVLSESTEAYDRGEKFAHYMRVPSLRAYILVAQTQRRIEVFHRPQTRGHWQQDVFEADDAMLLHGGSIPLDEIYGA